MIFNLDNLNCSLFLSSLVHNKIFWTKKNISEIKMNEIE